MGDYEKHIRMAREKLKAVRNAFKKGQHTVIGDLATKVVEQLVEADAARENTHFGTHLERHEFSGDRYPKEINSAMKKCGLHTVISVTMVSMAEGQRER